MTRMQTLIVAATFVLVLPVGAAVAQMTPTAPPDPITNPAAHLPTSPDTVPSPMQEEALVPNVAPVSTICGPHSVTLKDEFGRTYNCRGDRVR